MVKELPLGGIYNLSSGLMCFGLYSSEKGKDPRYSGIRYYLVITRGITMATSLKLDDALRRRIQHLAEVQQRSAHWIMCEAIRDYVEREEVKEKFKQEALTSWAAYQETGQHLTAEEVRVWLEAWGTDEEKEMPRCHE